MNKKAKFVTIDEIEEIGQFNDEWVYDLEMDDKSHTFISNNILVHNTDSIFVSFKPAIDSCDWKDQIFNSEVLSSLRGNILILTTRKDIFNIIDDIKINNKNHITVIDNLSKFKESLGIKYDEVIIDGEFVKNWELNSILENNSNFNVFWNWSNERDFIQGIDKFKYADYFKCKLDEHAAKYGVENKEDFELERISESIINIKKKKYIQHIIHEDGIDYDRLKYFFPKGVELVRSSTPFFAREKIIDIIRYLFSNPDTYNIKDLIKYVKKIRKEFELANIDDICMQSSVSNYDRQIIKDDSLPLEFKTGSHFSVKASAYYNYLLAKNKIYQQKYEFIKSGTKIKYYVTKDTRINDRFAYIRGSFPIEFAPEIDYDSQFEKSILSPINSIIEPLNMPAITKRLSVVLDIFSGF